MVLTSQMDVLRKSSMYCWVSWPEKNRQPLSTSRSGGSRYMKFTPSPWTVTWSVAKHAP